MNKYESDYFTLLFDVLSNGKKSSNRTGINTRKVWGRQTHIDLNQGFPLLTTKKIHWKSVVHELLWMISGDTNIRYLLQNGVTFWTEWPYQQYLKSSNDSNSTSVSSFGSTAFSQKEFEQTIINNEEFAKKWGSVGRFAYGGLWRRFPCYDNSDPYGHNVNSQHPFGTEWDIHYETSSGESCEVGYVDQLTAALNDLKTNSDSRRIIISSWHPYHSNRKEDAVLPACHNYIQFGTEELTVDEQNRLLHDKCWPENKPFTGNGSHNERVYHNIPTRRLNCYYSMRSSDVPLGMPYNVAFYALFTHLISHCLNMVPGQLVHNAADAHIYENQIVGIREQLSRSIGELPTVKIKDSAPKDIFSIKYDDIELVGYNPQPAIFIPVAV
jgi:thymidylate synthase